jgi:hypothetical protein
VDWSRRLVCSLQVLVSRDSASKLAQTRDRDLGESVAVGPDGRVYITNGRIFVYDGDGGELGASTLQLIFDGGSGDTPFVLAHHTLYSVQPLKAERARATDRDPSTGPAGHFPLKSNRSSGSGLLMPCSKYSSQT